MVDAQTVQDQDDLSIDNDVKEVARYKDLDKVFAFSKLNIFF